MPAPQQSSAPIAIIDMGTNTFHLLVATKHMGRLVHIFERKQAVQLGKGGISKGILADEAMARAIACLQSFAADAARYGIGPQSIKAYATSAVRSAANQQAFLDQVCLVTGIEINVITGPTEAAYIFEGVRASGALANAGGPALVMDIGGGSVEFILGTEDGPVLWLQSFEIGGQRLVDTYMHQDPIHVQDACRLRAHAGTVLHPLQQACMAYKPTTLVGASGTFDTLRQFKYNQERYPRQPWAELEPQALQTLTAFLLTQNRAQRLEFAAISELRAEMIVVALLLLEVAFGLSGATRLRQSDFALKEGVAVALL